MFIKNTAAATDHKFPTTISDDLFEQACSQWRTNTWVKKCQSLITVLYFINWMRPILPIVCDQHLCIVFGYYLIDRILEKNRLHKTQAYPGAR